MVILTAYYGWGAKDTATHITLFLGITLTRTTRDSFFKMLTLNRIELFCSLLATSCSSLIQQSCKRFLDVGPKAKSSWLVFAGCTGRRRGEIAELKPSHPPPNWDSAVIFVCSLPRTSWHRRNTWDDKSAYNTHVDLTPGWRDSRPRFWKYVSKSRGQSNCTCRAICDLSMTTFAAFVVTNTQKLVRTISEQMLVWWYHNYLTWLEEPIEVTQPNPGINSSICRCGPAD